MCSLHYSHRITAIESRTVFHNLAVPVLFATLIKISSSAVAAGMIAHYTEDTEAAQEADTHAAAVRVEHRTEAARGAAEVEGVEMGTGCDGVVLALDSLAAAHSQDILSWVELVKLHKRDVEEPAEAALAEVSAAVHKKVDWSTMVAAAEAEDSRKLKEVEAGMKAVERAGRCRKRCCSSGSMAAGASRLVCVRNSEVDLAVAAVPAYWAVYMALVLLFLGLMASVAAKASKS